MGPEEYFTISFPRNLAADDVGFEVQISNGLRDWRSGAGEVEWVRSEYHGDGTSTETYRSAVPMGVDRQEFMRVVITLK
jgi:hypothetical protein